MNTPSSMDHLLFAMFLTTIPATTVIGHGQKPLGLGKERAVKCGIMKSVYNIQ